jgi:adenosine kinase
MSAVICGSLAYDTIMVFQDQFKNHILPDQVHILNVSFLVPRMRREFGGCAGNIAYNLKLLGGDPLPVAAVGQDFAPYREHMEQVRHPLDCVRVFEDQFTPQCFITTDLDNNQITAFHPGAMSSAHENHVRDIPGHRASASSRPMAAMPCCSTWTSSPHAACPSSSIPARRCRCSTATNSAR